MEQDGVKVTDLPSDILRRIMASLAMSNQGASSFAKAISVCKAFKHFSNDREILKVTNFNNMEQHYLNQSLWNDNGLLTKCASVGNNGAHRVIQQLPFILLAMGEM